MARRSGQSDLNQWTTQSSMLTQPRSSHGAAVGGDGRIYVAGGNGSGETLDAAERHTPGSTGWFTVPNMPTARKMTCAATAPNGSIYVIGGNPTGAGGDRATVGRRVERFDPETNSWSRAAAMPTGRDTAAATTGPDGRIYVLGGIGSDQFTATASDAVEVFTPAP